MLLESFQIMYCTGALQVEATESGALHNACYVYEEIANKKSVVL